MIYNTILFMLFTVPFSPAPLTRLLPSGI